MIVVIHKGKSFVGAGRYYLHDKASAKDKEEGREHLASDERLAWTDTRNCANFDPELAMVEMWKTADAQAELKIAAGRSTGGQKTRDPVMTLSLSWHPTETPTPEQMIAAADSFLARMGWSEHQAVYIGHDDTAHPHVHIVLNRVHPETGLTLDDYNDHKRARAWALDYEREHGRIWCEKRLETENETGRASNDNIPHDVIAINRDAERQFQTAEVAREDLDKVERALLKADQRAEREAWFDAGRGMVKDTRHAVYDAVREDYRETWKEFYAERAAALEDAKEASGTAVGRAMVFARAGEFGQAWEALGDSRALVDLVEREFDARKAAITAAQRDEVREQQSIAVAALMEEREQGYKDLLERQQAVRDEMRTLHDKGERASDLIADVRVAREANENTAEKAPAAPAVAVAREAETAHTIAALQPPVIEQPTPAREPVIVAPPHDASRVLEDQELARQAHADERIVTNAADLGAGMIGSVASYLADQLAETFAPTPPEVRAAQAKALAEAQDRAEDSKAQANPYAKHIGEADQKARSEREEDERDRHWDDERERRRER